MTLAQGTKLGPYEIAAPLGAGGMGEVYRASRGGHFPDVLAHALMIVGVVRILSVLYQMQGLK